MMELERLEKRLEAVEERMWLLEMADILRGKEKDEWEDLRREKLNLIIRIGQIKRGE